MVYQSAVEPAWKRKKNCFNTQLLCLNVKSGKEVWLVLLRAAWLKNTTNQRFCLIAREGLLLVQHVQLRASTSSKRSTKTDNYLIKYGGHPMAAGLSIAAEKISEFREGLSRSISRMSSGLVLEKSLEIDAYLPLSNINESLLIETEQLAPFGPGNSPVVLVSRNLEIEKTSFIGKSMEHRKIIVKDQEGNYRNVIWWGSADSTLPEGQFDLAFYVRRDDYRSNGEISLEWLDFREARSSTIEVLPEIKRFRIHDYRTAPNQFEILEKSSNKTRCSPLGGRGKVEPVSY